MAQDETVAHSSVLLQREQDSSELEWICRSLDSIELRDRNARQMTRTLLDQYGFPDWNVEIDKRPTSWRYGCCKWNSKSVGLSEFYLAKATDDEIEDLILHEIAHVLSPGSYHYKVWKEQYARLLWKHMKDRAFVKLQSDQYCKRTAKKLLDFAKKNEAAPIMRRLPSPFCQPMDAPWKTTPAYRVQWSHIQPVRLVAENAKHYVWASNDDISVTGNVWKGEHEIDPLFMSWEDAREWLINKESSKLDMEREMWADESSSEFDLRVKRLLKRIDQLKAMTAPTQS